MEHSRDTLFLVSSTMLALCLDEAGVSMRCGCVRQVKLLCFYWYHRLVAYQLCAGHSVVLMNLYVSIVAEWPSCPCHSRAGTGLCSEMSDTPLLSTLPQMPAAYLSDITCQGLRVLITRMNAAVRPGMPVHVRLYNRTYT